MDRPAPLQAHHQLTRQLAISLCIGLALAVQIYWRNLHFLNVNFDGWSYWEGAAALSAGKGYVDLFGHPIAAFPPLFSLYLSCFARHGELTLGAIKSSFVVLAFLGGLIWTWLAQREFSAVRSPFRWFALVLPLLLFPVYFDMLLSEPLWLVLVGALLMVLTQKVVSPRRYLAVGCLVSLCLLTRNVSIALLPALPLFTLPRYGLDDARNVLLASLAGALPWLAVRSLTGSSGSHRYGVDLLALPSDFAHSLMAMGRDFTYSRLVIGPLLLAALVAASLVVIRRVWHRRPNETARQALAWLLFAIALFVFTVLISHLTMVGAAQTRFYLIALVASLFGILLTASLLPSRSASAVLVLLVALFASSALYRNGFFLATKLALPPADDSFHLSRAWVEEIHQHVQAETTRGRTLEQALEPYPISVIRYKHWMRIPYPLQSH